MKHLLFILLLSGSVWGQTWSDTLYDMSQDTAQPQKILTEREIISLIRAEIERWEKEKNKSVDPFWEKHPTIDWNWFKAYVDSVSIPMGGIFNPNYYKPEPLRMVIDTVWENRHRCDREHCDWEWLQIVRIDTLYDLTESQVEKLR